jgi:ABC-type molybdenum transport system ATPase subunit/photorepair protein PhrA
VTLQRKVAVFTPEIFAAFPRRLGQGALTVRDAIGTGFENTYSYRPLNAEQMAIREDLILRLAPGRTDHERQQWGVKLFAELSTPEQSLALFMRTMVSKAPLLILDEIFGCMDDQTIKKCSDYLRENVGQEQAAIFVSHWEHEVPWPDAQRYEIVDGIGRISK